jgi:hypothetical protein
MNHKVIISSFLAKLHSNISRHDKYSDPLLDTPFYPDILFGLFFDPEDESHILRRNLG